jgi:hypothetical protein
LAELKYHTPWLTSRDNDWEVKMATKHTATITLEVSWWGSFEPAVAAEELEEIEAALKDALARTTDGYEIKIKKGDN